MKGLLIEYSIPKLAIGRIAGLFSLKGFLTEWGFLKYRDLPEPRLFADDWVTIKTRYCGICGSDHKQLFLDGNLDNPMTAMISWPQVLGHEVVGTIEKTGPKVTRVKPGDRVVLNPWISCAPRGIDPPCPSCAAGKNTLCRNFKKGRVAPGIHTGNSRDLTGGFAEFVPAHESMVHPIPDHVPYKQAVLADPFSVAFHSILKARPRPGSVCAIYGCGNLGLLTVLILKKIFKDVRVLAIARFAHQAEMATRFGADLVIDSSPAWQVVERVAEFTRAEVYAFKAKQPWLIEGVDYTFDTVASKETLAIGMRITRARKKDAAGQLVAGAVVITGVASPHRYEWTPWYFKDLALIGSNAFAVEDYDGRFEHSYYHYFRFLEQGLIDPSPMVTHEFPLSAFKEAIVVSHEQKTARAIKVVFAYPGNS
jgi:threonine dehydrogenase-like Zn-dependent dehydrogenase